MSSVAHLRPVAEIARGDISAADVARSCMTTVVNGESGPARLNAFISFDYESAISQAERIDADAAGGASLPLRGLPVGVKDNICTLGLPTTCASRMLAAYRSPYDATAVARLRRAGAVIVGKTNLDEFAMGSSTATSAFGSTLNPHDRARVAGGSSGGSAAAVAAGLVPAALGSDTGGSVRQPAAFCGVTGIRPTYGRVSRYGLIAFASSLDQIGVLGRSVADAALLLEVISGADPHDATCAALPTDGIAAAADSGAASRPVVGVPAEYFTDGVHPDVRAACERAIEKLRAAGSEIRRVSLPHTHHAIAVYCTIAAAEASANLARFDGVRFGSRSAREAGADVPTQTRSAGFGAEVKRRIVLGTLALSGARGARSFDTACRVRSLIAQDFARAFDSGIDVLFTPTTPTPAFRADEDIRAYAAYSSDVFTAPASLAGLPAMSVPIGLSERLPIGGQIIAAHWREDIMIATAALLEERASS